MTALCFNWYVNAMFHPHQVSLHLLRMSEACHWGFNILCSRNVSFLCLGPCICGASFLLQCCLTPVICWRIVGIFLVMLHDKVIQHRHLFVQYVLLGYLPAQAQELLYQSSWDFQTRIVLICKQISVTVMVFAWWSALGGPRHTEEWNNGACWTLGNILAPIRIYIL